MFSCGTSKDGDSFLVEWNESEGAIRRTYSGLKKKSGGVVQFDTARNHFLVVGEDNQIKFWDMDNVNLLIHTDAGGGLPVSCNPLRHIHLHHIPDSLLIYLNSTKNLLLDIHFCRTFLG